MKEVRRHWLKELLRERFDGDREKFMAATNLTKGRVSQYMTSGFGDVAARNLLRRLAEAGYRLPKDYFDRPIPRADASVGAAVTPLASRSMSAVEAFEVFAAAVNRLTPTKRRRVIDSTGAYAADLTDTSERDYVVSVLSGEPPARTVKRKSANGG